MNPYFPGIVSVSTLGTADGPGAGERVTTLHLENAFNTFRTDLLVQPFMQSPIIPSQSCSICIRMALGSFTMYTRESLLHCGISDSKGFVHHFDDTGHHCSKWIESVCYRVESLPAEQWDKALSDFHSAERCAYNAISNNCYDYTVGFLNNISYLGKVHSKDSIAAGLLEPAMLKAEEYLAYYRQLSDS